MSEDQFARFMQRLDAMQDDLHGDLKKIETRITAIESNVRYHKASIIRLRKEMALHGKRISETMGIAKLAL